jgi:hypothetical protein
MRTSRGKSEFIHRESGVWVALNKERETHARVEEMLSEKGAKVEDLRL